jgi:hypothetical protein
MVLLSYCRVKLFFLFCSFSSIFYVFRNSLSHTLENSSSAVLFQQGVGSESEFRHFGLRPGRDRTTDLLNRLYDSIRVCWSNLVGDLYAVINLDELLNLRWAKKDKEVRSPNGKCIPILIQCLNLILVLRLTQRFNAVSSWIATRILTVESLKERGKVMRKIIQIAIHLRNVLLSIANSTFFSLTYS